MRWSVSLPERARMRRTSHIPAKPALTEPLTDARFTREPSAIGKLLQVFKRSM